MIDKNPYEKDDVNVPNFTNQETNGDGPIFNMDTTSITTQTDSFDPMEEAESSSKTAIIVLVAFLILFVIGSITGWIFGITKSKEAANVQEEFDTYKVTSQKQITDLESQVSALQLEIEANKNNNTSSEGSTSTDPGTKTEANTYYLMEESVSVRPSAGATDSYADYSKLPDDIKNIVYQDGSKVTTRAAKFPVYETKTVGSTNWGRIADNAWVCIDYGTKQ